MTAPASSIRSPRSARTPVSKELTDVVCGYLHSQDPLFDPGLRVFPPVLVVRPPDGPAADWVRANVAYALKQTALTPSNPGIVMSRLPELLLVEAGLLRRPEEGEPIDYFRSRVIFPIGDRAGRMIAFGGRVIDDGQPKYLNSPESPLFEKGRVLYGWSAARAAVARQAEAGGVGAIVTEGYMDVIALHRAGFPTAVAPLGTALTEFQLRALWRLSPEPILCFDGDSAGQSAAIRALRRALPLLLPGQSLRFATLPAGQDPDSLLRTEGRVAFEEVR